MSCVSSSTAERPRVRAVAEHDRPVGDGPDLPQPMRDVDDRHALIAERRDDLVQPRRLGERQAGGWLVHDEQPRLERQRLRDLDELLLRDRQGHNWCVCRDRQAEPIEAWSNALPHARVIDQTERSPVRRLASEEHVAGDVEVVEEVQLLVDERDAQRRGGVDVRDRHAGTVEQDLARVGLLDPADDLHQR